MHQREAAAKRESELNRKKQSEAALVVGSVTACSERRDPTQTVSSRSSGQPDRPQGGASERRQSIDPRTDRTSSAQCVEDAEAHRLMCINSRPRCSDLQPSVFSGSSASALSVRAHVRVCWFQFQPPGAPLPSGSAARRTRSGVTRQLTIHAGGRIPFHFLRHSAADNEAASADVASSSSYYSTPRSARLLFVRWCQCAGSAAQRGAS